MNERRIAAADLAQEELLNRPESHDMSEVNLEYVSPTMVDLGSSVELMQQSSFGQLRDGNGGWYVWGS